MPVVLKNRAYVSTATTGTGTLTLGSPISGYQSFADAGVSDGDTVRYTIEDGANFEIGEGVYTATGTTLSRTPSESSNSGSAINLSGGARVFITPTAADIQQPPSEGPFVDGDKTKLDGIEANADVTDAANVDPLVDTHLNTSTATSGEFLSWNGSDYDWAAAGADLYTANPSSATDPTASGTNAIAIGSSASAGGTDSFAAATSANASAFRSVAVGPSTTASSGTAVAIGYNANAGGSGLGGDTALGYNAVSAGQDAAALTNSYASGTGSFAAAITNNTSTYGATGVYGVAIGRQSKATALGAAAFGYTARADGSYSVALGRSFADAQDSFAAAIGDSSGTYGAKNQNSVAIGQNAHAGWNNSIAIGTSAATGATNQIALGGTANQVKISGTYTLPTSDGTNGQVLTTDGAGAVTFADAAGGADLYAANPVSATDPTASGTNAIAIGDGASATSNYSLAIGTTASASSSNAVAMGYGATASSGSSLALGRAASAAGWGFDTALGYNAVTAGSSGTATALANSYASGGNSLAAAIANNTSSYGATGANSIALGQQAKASQTNALAINGTASGVRSIAIGDASSATATSATAIGYSTTAVGSALAIGVDANAQHGYSAAILRGKSEQQGKMAFSGMFFGTKGDAQGSTFVLLADTTDATATRLTGNNLSASTNNQIILPNNSAYAFHGTIVARQQASGGTASAAWKVEGLIRREGSAGTTVLVNSATTVLDNTPSWGMALSADTTNGGLAITATGAASTNIRWVATIHTSEVTYA